MTTTEPVGPRGRDWAREPDRYGNWGDDSLYREPGFTSWDGVDVHDELWRAQNPGASLMRGLLWALPLSALLWVLAGLAVLTAVRA